MTKVMSESSTDNNEYLKVEEKDPINVYKVIFRVLFVLILALVLFGVYLVLQNYTSTESEKHTQTVSNEHTPIENFEIDPETLNSKFETATISNVLGAYVDDTSAVFERTSETSTTYAIQGIIVKINNRIFTIDNGVKLTNVSIPDQVSVQLQVLGALGNPVGYRPLDFSEIKVGDNLTFGVILYGNSENYYVVVQRGE